LNRWTTLAMSTVGELCVPAPAFWNIVAVNSDRVLELPAGLQSPDEGVAEGALEFGQPHRVKQRLRRLAHPEVPCRA
jgi:hypothetical protein